MQRFGQLTGRSYQLFDYFGHPEARHVVISMGSGSETLRTCVEKLAQAGERVGCVAVRLFRPFAGAQLVAALPASVERIAVLDRVKEPGATGEPLYLDVLAALDEHGGGRRPLLVGGRYGLSSKEFSPAMAVAVFEELRAERPRKHFRIGIVDDVTHLSLRVGEPFDVLPDGVYQALFYGLGADGTVGANKNTIKILHETTELHTQGYFAYDSRKSGAVTVSHLRFAPAPFAAPYQIDQADLVAVHQFEFFERMDVLERSNPSGLLLINAPFSAEQLWQYLSREVQAQLCAQRPRLYVVDADRIARASGLGGRINTVMQLCFFAVSQLLPTELAQQAIKGALEYSYGKKGDEIVRRNVRQTIPAVLESSRQPAWNALDDACSAPNADHADQSHQNLTLRRRNPIFLAVSARSKLLSRVADRVPMQLLVDRRTLASAHDAYRDIEPWGVGTNRRHNLV